MLKKALTLRDQQTAMQPRQPQGSATIMIKQTLCDRKHNVILSQGISYVLSCLISLRVVL